MGSDRKKCEGLGRAPGNSGPRCDNGGEKGRKKGQKKKGKKEGERGKKEINKGNTHVDRGKGDRNSNHKGSIRKNGKREICIKPEAQRFSSDNRESG